MMNAEMSAKNTKNEILEAYQEALEKLKAAKKASKQELKSVEEAKCIVTSALKNSTDEIVQLTAQLKLSLVRSLEEIEGQLLSSRKQLTALQQAIEIQDRELSELYEIKVQAGTLAALLDAQKERSAAFEMTMKERTLAFEQEMTQKRTTWKKEQEELESSHKEYAQQTKKSRQREEEEYVYQRDLTRQKEGDQYNLEKELLEKELASKRIALEQEFVAREAAILANEQEFKVLRQKAEKFPEELQKAIEESSESITEKLTFKFDYETKLVQKEVEGERKLLEQMIGALEVKVVHLESQMKHLSDKSNQANLQVQDIAVKAIESASLQRFMPGYTEKSIEQVK